MSTKSASGRERFHQIDLLRFTAAMLVVFYHYGFRATHAPEGLCRVDFPLLGSLFRYGYLGVDLFFLISGYVILMTALSKNIAGFAISRIVRLYPAYWVGVSLTALCTVYLGDHNFPISWSLYLKNMTLVGGLAGVEALDGVYWSLWVEMRFYLLVALFMAFGLLKYPRQILSGWVLAAVVIRWVGIDRIPFALQWILIPEWASYFAAGAFFFLVRRDGMDKLTGTSLLACLGLSCLYALDKAAHGALIYKVPSSPYWVLGYVAGFYLLFLLLALRKLEFLDRPGFLVLGVLTYPVYLVHQNIGFQLFNAAHEAMPPVVLFWGITALLLGVAWCIHYGVEKRVARPFQKLLESWVARLPTKLAEFGGTHRS